MLNVLNIIIYRSR
ncbi:hypothetical protein F383_33112 [Gossypium arboreum]|uniref:Uncharacterized protein n=1 Tax=Gossypium arboreum TaxID=29729 RepID=A0A0B0N635_GOSAR|nr:hypothetical protein F383_33112 [Gossypium arboreum]